MVRTVTLITAALLAMPALAQDRWSGDDDWSESRTNDDRGDWNDGDRDFRGDDGWRTDASDGPSWDDFRRDRDLSWSGEWIDTPEYGLVWRPTHVQGDWRPYSDGRWRWTQAGWSWESDEPFGWAVYHYGRWALVGGAGWVWLPGRVWAPAWVSWRYGDGFVGWCPLGPRRLVYERPQQWVFVESRFIFEPVRAHAVAPRYAQNWYAHARPIPVAPGPHAGPPRRFVERAIGRELRPMASSGPRVFAPRPIVSRPVSRPSGEVQPGRRSPGPTARQAENRQAPPAKAPAHAGPEPREGDHGGPHVRQ